nr:protein FAR1-related sequence 5 [Tanacetum cinerariifolium]
MWESAKTLAPTPNSATVRPDVDDNFVINSTHFKMIWENKFDCYLRADPHDHIRKFLVIRDMFKYGETQSYQNQNSHDSYSHQSHHDPNDSEKSLTELNDDVKNDLEDFKNCIRSMRTVHSKLFDRDDGKTAGVLPNKKSEPVNQEPQSKTNLEKSITKFLDSQRVANMFFKNNVNDMILKMKQNEKNIQTKFKNMETKIDEWEKSQNISLEQTDMIEPPPSPQTQTEQVNAVFTGSRNCVPSGISLSALTKEIFAYEKENDEIHHVKKLDALYTPESFVTHSNFDTPGGTIYYIPKVYADVLLVKGNVYDSVDDCVVAYMKYVAEAGFVVRHSCQKRLRNGDVKQKYLVCNRKGCLEGIHVDTLDLENSDKQKRNSNLHITGCKARAVFNLDPHTRKFVLNVFDTIHNQKLKREEFKYLSKIERQSTYLEQVFIVKAASVNIGATRAHHLLTGIKGSYLLADEVSKYDYRVFGDVVSFDATFKTNKYKMVFVPFAAIDNHKKCVTIYAKIYDETDFKEKLNKIVWNVYIGLEEFKYRWVKLMEEFKLENHKEWNSFFSHFTNSGSTLMNFMKCFETAMKKQRHVQEKMDHKTIDVIPKLKTFLKIARHVSNVYTRSLFELVQKEIFVGLWHCQIDSKSLVEGSEVCIIKESPYVYEMPKKKKKPQSVDKVKDKAEENNTVDLFFKKDELYKVLRNVEDGSFVCSCQLFVRVSISCKHIFCVFKNANVEMILQQYILRRWTKNLILAALRNKRNIYGEKNVVVENFANDATLIVDHCVHLLSKDEPRLGAFVEKLKSLKKEVDADCPNPLSKNKTDNLEQLVGVLKPPAVYVNNPTVGSTKIQNNGTDHNKRTCPRRFKVVVQKEVCQEEVVVKKEVCQEEVVQEKVDLAEDEEELVEEDEDLINE